MRSCLKKFYIDDAKVSKVYEYLYGEDGQTPLTAEQLEAYYQENYVHFQMIFINNKYRNKTDSNGKYITDDSGLVLTEELDEDTKAQRDAAIQKVQEGLAAGAEAEAEDPVQIAIKEYFCDGYSLYLSFEVTSEEPLMEGVADIAGKEGGDFSVRHRKHHH